MAARSAADPVQDAGKLAPISLILKAVTWPVRRSRCSAAMPAAGAIFLSACSMVGSIEERAETVNLAAATYVSSAILYNVLRASEAEPLNFVSFTGVTGHEGSSAGIGLPTIIVGPGRTLEQHLFLFGPNTVSASASNDFNISVVDDPASQAALLTPVDPATMGFFINQGYNPDHVFFLFMSKIIDVDKSGKVIGAYNNEPYGYMQPDDHCRTVNDFGFNCHWNSDFYDKLRLLLKYRFSVEVDPRFVPAQAGSGIARFCFSPNVPPGIDSAALAVSSINAIRDTCRPALLAPEGKIMPPDEAKGSKSTFSFPDPVHADVEVHVYTRSVYGAYRFLGELLKLYERRTLSEWPKNDPLFSPEPEHQGTRMLNLTHDRLGCWAKVDYEDEPWCVPAAAQATKRTFQIMQQLFRLFASPSNQPVTQTVRTIPGG
jgi:hypothetical protein